MREEMEVHVTYASVDADAVLCRRDVDSDS